MQLHFTAPQLQLLADILGEQKDSMAERLLERVMGKDLRFDCDELEQLSVLLKGGRAEVVAQLATCSKEVDAALEHKKQLLEEMLERVSEASAMV